MSMVSRTLSLVIILAFTGCSWFSVSITRTESNAVNTTPSFCEVNSDLSPFAGGSGTSDDPYLICSPAQWFKIAESQNLDKYFALKGDLDFSSVSATGWTQIGTDLDSFYGQINGNGYSIKNANLTRLTAGDYYVGLIGNMPWGKIYNLNVSNSAMTSTTASSSGCSGFLVGSVGRVELTDLKLTNVQMTSTTSGAVSPLVGCARGSQLTRISTVSTQASGRNGSARTGGLVGEKQAGSSGDLLTITDSSVTALTMTETGPTGSNLGGLIGRVWSGVQISNTTVSGLSISGTNIRQSGGMIGTIGGGMGNSTSVDISNSSVNLSVNVGQDFGGIIGLYNSTTTVPVTISQVSLTGSITGTVGVGGLIGRMVTPGSAGDSFVVSRIRTNLTIAGTTLVGGLIGRIGFNNPSPGSVINQAVVEGSVSGSGNSIGGVIGGVDDATDTNAVFREIAMLASVGSTAGAASGGFIGTYSDAGMTLRDSVFRGNVNCVGVTASCGGIIGRTLSSGLTSNAAGFTNVVFTGTVSGGSTRGAFFGDSPTIIGGVRLSNHFDNAAGTLTARGGGADADYTPQSTANMLLAATFAGYPLGIFTLADGVLPKLIYETP
ncbi:MAG: hypothetical protein WCH11_00275 [Bdellovibrio sp.]